MVRVYVLVNQREVTCVVYTTERNGVHAGVDSAKRGNSCNIDRPQTEPKQIRPKKWKINLDK